jgi:hypothetical protein
VTLTDRIPGALEEARDNPRHGSERDDLLLPVGTRMVHIGPHKTGTTAVQSALFAARSEIQRQGVIYASEGRHAMTAVLAGLQLPDAWSEYRTPPPRWKWTRLLRKVTSAKADRVVMSSEFFADGEPDAIRRVVDELDPERIHVIVTLRPLARIVPSQWQQAIQNQLTTPLDQWVRDLLDKPEGAAGSFFWRRHRHDLLVQRWAQIVGTDRVTAIALDEGDPDMLLRVFERLTGLRAGTLQAAESITNRSMTLPEIELIRAFNIAYKAEKLPRRLYTRVIRFGAAALMEARPPLPDEPRLTLPGWSIEPIGAMARQIVEGIRQSGVRVIGDLEGLLAAPEPADETAVPAAVSPEVAASALMGVLVATGVARGSGRISVDAGEAADDDAAPGARVKTPSIVQEPAELFRLSSAQIAIVLVRRARAAVTSRIGRLAFWRR